jgi:hypothetical protein
MHLYIVVNCKTANCRTAHVLTYVGEREKTSVSVEYVAAVPEHGRAKAVVRIGTCKRYRPGAVVASRCRTTAISQVVPSLPRRRAAGDSPAPGQLARCDGSWESRKANLAGQHRESETTVKCVAFTPPKVTWVVSVSSVPVIFTDVPTTPLVAPVFPPAGTVALISELEKTLNVASVPPKVTLVAPVRSVPENNDGRFLIAKGGQRFQQTAQNQSSVSNLEPRGRA